MNRQGHQSSASSIIGILATIVAWSAFSSPVLADTAVHIDGGTGGSAAGNSVHGWEFTVSTDVTVTELGLWDQDQDGFIHDHPIGLFRLSDSALLTSGMMHAGAGDPLDDGFRYIDVADVTLVAGVHYVVSYYSAFYSGDLVVTNPTGEVFAPEVTWIQGRWGTDSGGLIIPPNPTGADRYGPNFKFDTGGGDYTLSLSGDCPGTVTVSWRNATPGVQQAIVFGNNLGRTTIPPQYPCSGTVLGIAGSVRLVEPPGFFSTGNGMGTISGHAGTAACGHYLQLVEGGSCNVSNPAQIP